MAPAKADSTLLAKQNEWQGQLELSAYIEAYYQYDFNKPANGLRPAFVYSFHRNNIPNINLAMVKFSYNSIRFRANAAAMGGTYSVANMANEPIYLRNIFEANFGFKLLKQKQLWLDAGVLPSHIGFESAIGKNPNDATKAVINTGRNLVFVPFRTTFSKSCSPDFLRRLNSAINTIPFKTATPNKAINPMPALMLKGIPRSASRKIPPMAESGIAV